ncbi:cysteine-rich CWC family protein [Colwellia maritima]|uniref:cysteine-rich CWC family protein n=1 Tax=Colwellia maritima TaxID=2912588 RepID=UPI003B8498DC
MQNSVNAILCPFCKGINNCMVNSNNACRCSTAKIPNELTAIVPAALRRTSCICENCINLFNNKPDQFKRQYILTSYKKQSA